MHGIESNPGPNFSKVVQGSFHQGDPKFGETAGFQCTGNSYIAICFSAIKKVSIWKSWDLDYILNQGDALFKLLQATGPLAVDEMPHNIMIENQLIQVDFLRMLNGLFLEDMDLFETHQTLALSDIGNGAIFTCAGYSFALIWDLGKHSVYLFDSHSKVIDDFGCSSSSNGNSTLLEFPFVHELNSFIRGMLEPIASHETQYDIQYIQVNVTADAISSILSKLNRNRKTEKQKTQRKRKRNFNVAKTQCKRKRNFDVASGNRVLKFTKLVKQGPVCICVICNRSLYKKSVRQFNKQKYEDIELMISEIPKKKSEICQTCHKSLKKGKMPPQAVFNKLEVPCQPEPLKKLNRLERVLISRRILFKKVTIMPKGQFPKLKGCICNVPIETTDVTDVLPRGADSNGLVMVKLKRKLAFQGHVYFEAVSPEAVVLALQYLKKHNPLYGDIEICYDNIQSELLDLSESKTECFSEEPAENSENLLEDDNPLDIFRLNAQETMLIPIVSSSEEISIAPGEGQQPYSLLTDKHCEELSFPYLFPQGKFGYSVDRELKLSPTKYFNQRLLNYTQRFSSDSDYIFFALSVVQQKMLTSQINVAMKKVCSNQMTAGMLSNNFSDTVKSIVSKDDGYQFMSAIKGTPAYWKKFLFEVLAMVKQLGLPTFFMTLSCADLRWNELISIIAELQGENLTDDDISEMDYFERTRYLNLNPVLLARHFQYRVETFFQTILVNGPLGKVHYHAIRVEFQVRGSPHIHSFLWVVDALILTDETTDEYIAFVDSIVKATVPDIALEKDLFNLVTTYQIHSHSKSCRKYKNQLCRYRFGKFFTDHTIIAKPLAKEITEEQKQSILQKRDKVLSSVQDYIDTYLNPKKRNILDPSKENFESPPSISEILQHLQISQEEYYNALSISCDLCFQIHLKRPPNSCFVNNYFAEGLLAWKANIDIQPVFNHYKAVTYMCAYFSKAENETSNAMKQAAKDAVNCNKSHFEQMKAVARAFVTKRECSVQEAIYLLMPELWLRKTFPRVIFANNNLPEKRYRIFRSKEEIDELPDDSTDIFQRNMIDRYLDRPNMSFKNGKYKVLDSICFAQFLSHYYLTSKKFDEIENDFQPVVLNDELMESNHEDCNFPKVIPLMSSKEKLQCRKVKAVLRYHVPNKNKHPEEYAHHLLFMFLPFRNEDALKSANGSYVEKLQDPGVIDIINQNKQLFEPYSDLVQNALLNFHTNHNSSDAYLQQENDSVQQELLDTVNEIVGEDPSENAVVFDEPRMSVAAPIFLCDDELNDKIRSLNKDQRKIFNVIYNWAKNKVKNLNTLSPISIAPLHIFLTGNAGCGKSFLTNVMHHSLSKIFSYRNNDIENPKVLLMAPTGVAAINIDAITIHTALGIPVGNFGKNLPALGDKRKSYLRNKYSDLKVIIIDEISMVSNYTLLHIHMRLLEIFGSSCEAPFAGLTVIAVGDFFQLPPIGAKPVYAEYRNTWENLDHLWKYFKIAELTQVMRQQGDNTFIDLLNHVRIAKLQPEDIAILKSRFISLEALNYPKDAIHLFAENAPVTDRNLSRLGSVSKPLYQIPAVDILPKNMPVKRIEEILNQKQSDTGGLATILKIKVDARVMLTVNIDIQDRLINGQIGTVKHILSQNGKVSMIYIKFDDPRAGIKRMNVDPFARQHSFVPIEKVEASIPMRKGKELSSPVIKRTQFPLTLSYACTCHKVQGLSLDEAVISFDLVKQRSFNYGQMYVALSRVRSLEGLYLIGTFDLNAIKANPRVTAEYMRMHKECPLEFTDEGNLHETSLTICLLNIRSFNKHAADVSLCNELVLSDILCFTETQVLPYQISQDAEESLHNFGIHHNISNDRFQSLAFCFRKEIDIVENLVGNGTTIYTFLKRKFYNKPIKLLLLYRKNGTNLTQFFSSLATLIAHEQLDIILGDFNIDGLNLNLALNQVMANYNQLVSAPTHLSGSLLDHVYVHKDFMSLFDVSTQVLPTYFSDHDAVKLKMICQ